MPGGIHRGVPTALGSSFQKEEKKKKKKKEKEEKEETLALLIQIKKARLRLFALCSADFSVIGGYIVLKTF